MTNVAIEVANATVGQLRAAGEFRPAGPVTVSLIAVAELPPGYVALDVVPDPPELGSLDHFRWHIAPDGGIEWAWVATVEAVPPEG